MAGESILEEEKRVEERAGMWGGGQWGVERERGYTWVGEREPFGSSFYMFFSSLWACPMHIGLGQESSST